MIFLNSVISSILFCLLLNISLFAQDLWEVIKTPVDVDLRRVFYLDCLNLWAAGDSGTIIYSSDKGDTWQLQSSNLEQRIEDIFFLNESLGWGLTWRSDGINFQSQILRTTDGGTNWSSANYRHINILLNAIFFTDSVSGWICGEPFDFAYSTDGGTEWYPANIDTGSFGYFPVQNIKFSTPQYGFAVGGAHDAVGVVWRTTNSGESWKAFGIGPDLFLDFIFLDSLNILALTAELEGFYPTGELRFNIVNSSWEYLEIDQYAYVTGMDKRTQQEIWGTLGNVTRSFIVNDDSLHKWKLISTPDSLIAFDIAFADSINGIAVGERGYILRYIPQKPVSVDDKFISSLPNEFFLDQNYPNPFNPSTKIKYTIPTSPLFSPYQGGAAKPGWFVSLNVYDLLGREVAKLVNEEQTPGRYEVEFSSSSVNKNLSSGIYFYKLQAGDYSDTKKMIYLK